MYVISLKRSIEESEQVLPLMKALRATLEAVSQYMVETDPTSLQNLRAHLNRIAEGVQAPAESPDGKALSEVPVAVRGELRDYRDAAKRYIDRLRTDLNDTARALQEMAETLHGQDSGAQSRLKKAIGDLRGLSTLNNLEEVRAGLRHSETTFTECMEQLRREKEGVIAQLRDEIRALQKSVSEAERSAAMDTITGAYKREEFQKLVRRDVVAERSIGIIHVWLRNLHEISSTNSGSLVDKLLTAFCKRIQSSLPAGALVGRWRDDIFCVLLPLDTADRASAELAKECGGRYVCMEDGRPCSFTVDVVVTRVGVQQRDNVDAIFGKIDRVQIALPK